MPEGLKKLLEPFLALSIGKRLVVGGVALASLLAFAALISIANKTDYRPLFAKLTTEDAGEIVKKLRNRRSPTRSPPTARRSWSPPTRCTT